MACEHSLFLLVASLKMMFSCLFYLMLMTWRPYFFLIIIFLFILILSWCQVTLVNDIGRHIIIIYFKRLAAYIIFLDTEASLCAEKLIDAHLVQVLLIAHH